MLFWQIRSAFSHGANIMPVGKKPLGKGGKLCINDRSATHLGCTVDAPPANGASRTRPTPLIPVGLVIRRQRAYGQRGTLAWAIVVYLFGLAGLVGYWFHRTWPARSTLAPLAAAGALETQPVPLPEGPSLAPAPTGLEIYG